MSHLPLINKQICTGCRLCAEDCTARAIDADNLNIIERRCILCGHCYAICPENAVSMGDAKEPEASPPSPALADDLEKLIKMRRSIRHYRNEPVEKELIERIANTAVHSPTGTNSRQTGITIIDNRETIKALSDIIMTHFEKMTFLLLNKLTYPLLILILGKGRTAKLFSYKKLISRHWEGKDILTHEAPLLMIFHSDRKASTPSQDGVIWATGAMLTAESLGIGTCFNGFLVIGINSCSRARKFLKLPKGHKVNETFTAGYPKFRYRRAVPRRGREICYL